MTKTTLLDCIQQQRTAWDAFVAAVDEAHMEATGAMGDWTFKDVVAHLPTWRQRFVALLAAAQRDELPPPPPWPAAFDAHDDTDVINQWIYERNRTRPLHEVLRESGQSFDALESAVHALSAQDLEDPTRFPWLHGEPLGAAIVGSSLAH